MSILKKKISDGNDLNQGDQKGLKQDLPLETLDKKQLIERPRICCLDLKTADFEFLKSEGYNAFEGTLGSVIRLPNNNYRDSSHVLLDYIFPPNFHEYDILILDLTNEREKPYDSQEHNVVESKDPRYNKLVCKYPVNIFDPRPYSSLILQRQISEIGERKFIQIVFGCKDYRIEYETVAVAIGQYTDGAMQNRGIYDFWPQAPLLNEKRGTEVTVCETVGDDLRKLLSGHKANLSYRQTFKHPKIWDTETQQAILSPNFFPLLVNINNEIVSFMQFEGNLTTVLLPDIENKQTFLKGLLEDFLPSLLPDVFPYASEFSWKEESPYLLPNESVLIGEKEAIVADLKKKVEDTDKALSANRVKYKFLHDLLTETGGPLVKAISDYLLWLGYKTVNVEDEKETSIKEEDLQVQLDPGLLIIEAKGIGGTSSDSDCSQISKIKHRRCKERGAFDVCALYIVNHQRHLPPLHRKNPPFTEHQISDAMYDERGLLSTWQLFNLYFEIETGLVTKEDARTALLQFGYIEFKPAIKEALGEIKKILKEGRVITADLATEIKVGQVLIGMKNGRYFKTTIQSIQVDNGQPVSQAGSGLVGIQLDTKIPRGAIFWTT